MRRPSTVQRAGIRARVEAAARQFGKRRELAIAARMHESSVSAIISGRRPVGHDVARRISLAVGADPDWVLTGEGPGPGGANDGWFCVYPSGRRLFVLSPRVEEIQIEDIAHHLSMICRFGGGCRYWYSVAEHSVLVSHLVPREFALEGLLHDGTEAYLGDIIRPLKGELPDYKRIEQMWELAIAVRFGLPRTLSPEVKVADRRALLTERRDLQVPHGWAWNEDKAGLQPCPEPLYCWPQEAAREAFLDRFRTLMMGRF